MSALSSRGAEQLVERLRGSRPWLDASSVRRALVAATGWAALVLVTAGIAIYAVQDRKIGLALAALVLLLGVFAADPVLLAVIALPGVFLLQRVGGASTNLSAADLLVFLGALVCLLHVRWSEARHLRAFLKGIVVYEATLIVVVAAHTNRYDVVEWFHRLSYLGGSVLVGWVVARHGRARQAFRLYLLGASVIAVIAMEHAVKLHFKAAQWGLYQKNAVGAMMWVAVVVAQVNPPWTGVSRRQARIAKWLCLGGLLASQSRQSWVVLCGAIVLFVLMNPEVRRRSKLLLLGIIPLGLLLYYSFSTQFVVNPKFNTVSIRLRQLSKAVSVWHLSPVLGEGMRFYHLPQFINVTQPPNVIIGNLASSGIVGSLGFVAFVVIAIRVVARLPVEFRTLGLVVLVGHLTEGLFDEFWIGSYSAASMIIVGIALGMADRARLRDPLRAFPGAPVLAGVGAARSGSLGAIGLRARMASARARLRPAWSPS